MGAKFFTHQNGEVLGQGLPDFPDDLKTFEERKAYQRGIADSRLVDKLQSESFTFAEAPAGQGEADRQAWLIEDQDHFPRHRWLRIVDAGKEAYLQWEHDANRATHFARRDDAVAFQKLHLDFCALSIVTGHTFMDATPLPAQVQPADQFWDDLTVDEMRLQPAEQVAQQQPVSAEVLDALNAVDDFIARCNGDDRGSCESVEILRRALSQGRPA